MRPELPAGVRLLFKVIGRILMLGIEGLFGVLVFALVLGYFLLSSQWGRETLLTEGLSKGLALTPFSVEFAGVRSDTSERWQLGQLTFSYQGQVLVKVHEMELVLPWKTLLARSLTVEALTVGRLWLNADPAQWPVLADDSAQPLPEWLNDWRGLVERVDINEIEIQHPALPSGLQASLKLSGLVLAQLATTTPEVALEQVDLGLQKGTQWLRASYLDKQLQGEIHLERFPLELLDSFLDDFNRGWLSADLILDGSLLDPHLVGKASTSTVLLEMPLVASTQLDYRARILDFSEFDGHWDSLHAQGQGRVRLDGDRLANNSLDIQVTQAEMPLSFVSNFDVHLPPALALDVAAEKVTIDGPFSAIRYRGLVRGTGHFDALPLVLTATVDGGLEELALEQVELQAQTLKLVTQGTIQFAGPLAFKGRFAGLNEQILAPLLAPIATPWSRDLAFTAAGEVQVSGSFAQPKIVGDVRAEGAYKNEPLRLSSRFSGSRQQVDLQQFDLALLNATADAGLQLTGNVNLAKSTLDLAMSAHNLPLALLALAGVELPPGLSGELTVQGTLRGPWILPLISAKGELAGMLQDQTYRLLLDGNFAEGSINIHDSQLLMNGQSLLVVDGQLAVAKQNLSVAINGLDLRQLALVGWDQGVGTVQAKLRYSGDFDHSDLHGQIDYHTELAWPNGQVQSAGSPLVIATTLNTIEQVAQIEAAITFDAQETSRLQLKVPLLPYRQWFQKYGLQSVLAGGQDRALPTQFELLGQLELKTLQVLMANDFQSFGGRTEVDLNASGTVNQPELNGELKLSEGYYKNDLTGTDLGQIELYARLSGQTLQIQTANASTPGEGQLHLSGEASWAHSQNVALKLRAENAQVFERPELESVLSGAVELTGDQQGYLLAGKVKLQPLTLRINSAFEGVPELKVTVLDRDERQLTLTNPVTDESVQFPLTVDLIVAADQQAFLQGRGLVSELQGEVKIFGPIGKLNYAGRFQALRGYMNLFNKRFELVKGFATFDDANVILDIRAEHVGREITYKVNVLGTLDNFKLDLTSDPVMPQDEILAHLLFGKSVKNMSPIQAIRLVTALQTLQGGNSLLPDPVEIARNLSRVDDLTIDSTETAEGTGVTVGVGKYLSDRVYLEVERTPDPNKPWQGRLDIELTPRLHLETTTTGSDGSDGVELIWKRDF